MNLEEKTKCPPGYKYDPKSKMCVDKNAERVARYRPYFGRYMTPKQEQTPKTNGNGNGNGNGNVNNNSQSGNGNGGSGNGNGGGGNGGGP